MSIEKFFIVIIFTDYFLAGYCEIYIYALTLYNNNTMCLYENGVWFLP